MVTELRAVVVPMEGGVGIDWEGNEKSFWGAENI